MLGQTESRQQYKPNAKLVQTIQYLATFPLYIYSHGCGSKPKVPSWGWLQIPAVVFLEGFLGLHKGAPGRQSHVCKPSGGKQPVARETHAQAPTAQASGLREKKHLAFFFLRRWSGLRDEDVPQFVDFTTFFGHVFSALFFLGGGGGCP